MCESARMGVGGEGDPVKTRSQARKVPTRLHLVVEGGFHAVGGEVLGHQSSVMADPGGWDNAGAFWD